MGNYGLYKMILKKTKTKKIGKGAEEIGSKCLNSRYKISKIF